MAGLNRFWNVDGYDPPFDEEVDAKAQPDEITCNRCGQRGLEWVDCGGNPTRWKLYQGSRLHVCKVVAPELVMDDFEDLTK